MKNTQTFAIVILLLFSHFQSIALGQNRIQSLFGGNGGENHLGFMVSASLASTKLDGGSASLFHVTSGIVLNDAITLGAFYSQPLNDIQNTGRPITGYYLDYWSAGGLVEFTLSAHRVIHLTFPLHFGVGEVEWDNDFVDLNHEETHFLVFEPSARLEVNLHDYARMSFGLGYRYISNLSNRNFFEPEDLEGLTGFIGLKIGLFR